MSENRKWWYLELDVEFCPVGDGQASVGDLVFVPHHGSILCVRISHIKGLVGGDEKKNSYRYACIIYYQQGGRLFSCPTSQVSKSFGFADGLSAADLIPLLGSITQ